MSLILDALRKMELERKAKRQSSPELRAEVLSYRGTPPTGKSPRLLLLLTAVLVVSLAGGALLYFKKPAAPPAPVPAPLPAALVTMPAPLPLPASLPQTPLPTAETVPEAVKPVNRPAPVQQKSAADSTISVSGIAWQEEHALRRAVINGILVGEGAEILGAKVVEIRENLVRFTRGGSSFEISYP